MEEGVFPKCSYVENNRARIPIYVQFPASKVQRTLCIKTTPENKAKNKANSNQ
jgi:hypothetical protein